jgi:ankyrin repeat protein
MWTELVFARDRARIAAALADSADRNPLVDETRTALALASACGYGDVIVALLDGGADVDRPNGDDLAYTPLIEAVREGKRDAVTLLLDRGASIQRGDSRDGAPLLHACIGADAALATLLLDRGAEVDAVDSRGQTALHHLARYAKDWGSMRITQTVDGVTAELENPRYRQHLAVVALPLARGASPNRLTAYGYSALHCAAGAGATEIIALLAAHGGDVNLVNSKSYAPIHAAADGGHADAVRALLDRGAAIDAADASGFTALIGATLAGSAETLALLVERGANRALTATEGYDQVAAGDTALAVATKLGRDDLVRLLS